MGVSRPYMCRLSIGLLLVVSSLAAPVMAQKMEFGAYVGYYYPEAPGIDNDVTYGPRFILPLRDGRFTAQGSFAYFKPQGQDYRTYFIELTGSVQFRHAKSLVPHLFGGPGWADVSTGLYEGTSLAGSGFDENSFTLNFGAGLKAYFDRSRDWYVDIRTTGRWYEARETSTVDREFSIGLGLVYGP